MFKHTSVQISNKTTTERPEFESSTVPFTSLFIKRDVNAAFCVSQTSRWIVNPSKVFIVEAQNMETRL